MRKPRGFHLKQTDSMLKISLHIRARTINMANMVKDVVKKVNLSKIVYSDIVVGNETHSAATARSLEWKDEFDFTFAPGKHIVYSYVNDQVLIHVCEYTVMENQNLLSTAGLCFTPGRLRAFRNKIHEIDELLWRQNLSRVPRMYRVEQGDVVYRAHLGAGVYVSVDKKYNGVDLRRHWVPEGQQAVFPTKEGIYMPVPQWNSFKENLNNLLSVHPELFHAQECSHEISLDVIDCKECLPFGLLCL